MSRLTEKIGKDYQCNNSECMLSYCDRGCGHYNLMVQKLAAYEDAEEQGLLLRLPYPFGTKLYYVIDDWDYGMSVNEVIFDLEFVSDVLRYPDEYFPTKEEAEQKLASMQKGE